MLKFLTKIAALLFLFAYGANHNTGALKANSQTNMTYEFIGDEKDKAGFAQGKITISTQDNYSGYYLLYFANDSGLIPNYDEFASIPITAKQVTYEVKDGTMLPVNATKLAAFVSDKRFLDDQPEYTSAVAIYDIPSYKKLVLGDQQLTFGAISDVHVNYETYGYGAYKKWENALEFFYQQGAEYIIGSGDITGDDGLSSEIPLRKQYEKYLEIIENSNFPSDKIYEAMGNHGNTDATIHMFAEYLSSDDEVHPYEYSPYYYKIVNRKKKTDRDNLFIFMSQELKAPGDSAKYDNFSKAQIDWVEGLLNEYGNRKDVNIFLIEHSPFLNFGPGDRHNGGYTSMVKFDSSYTQTMRLKGLLTKYKDVVMMSGHTHLSLYDLENYSDEYDSFCRMVHLSSGSQPSSYGDGSKFTRNTDGRYPADENYGSQAYMVNVYKDYIVYTGYNLSTNKVIPAACYLLPIKAYGGSGYTQNDDLYNLNEFLKGNGTESNPYKVENSEQFKKITDLFNSSNNGEIRKMMGYGKYFIQTKDIDMSNIDDYKGTFANGDAKCFFAGNYNGAGHSIKVNIDGDTQRSVFPYCYGTIYNLHLKGSISGVDSAQPIRTNYGAIINCIFDVNVKAKIANGICYSNYGYVYNIFTQGQMIGTNLNPIASNDTSTSYYNVFYNRVDEFDNPIVDEYGYPISDLNGVVYEMNDRASQYYVDSKAYLGNDSLCKAKYDGKTVKFEFQKLSQNKKTTTNPNKLIVPIVIGIVSLIVIVLIYLFVKRKNKIPSEN